MKFGQYLEANKRQDWGPYYINYKALKDLISLSAQETRNEEAGGPSSLRETYLSVVRTTRRQETAEERFFKRLEAEVSKIGAFTAELVSQLRNKMSKLQAEVASIVGEIGDGSKKDI